MTRMTFNIKKTTDYLSMFSSSFEFIETEKYIIAVFPNEFDDFRCFSYLNGLYLKQGGTHVDFLTNQIVDQIREKLQKKYKTIKPGDIKNRLMTFVLFRDFPDAQFDSQTKEKLQNPVKDIRDYLGDIDLESLWKKILRNKEIIDPITLVFEAKEKAKEAAELRKKEKVSKDPDVAKFVKPKGKDWDYLFIEEGDSARGSCLDVFGRNGIGHLSLFGVPMNTYEEHLLTIHNSPKMAPLVEVLGFRLSETIQKPNFKNVVLATDADLPGIHIRGLMMAFLYRFAPNMFDEGRIHILKTPMVVARKKDRVEHMFFDFTSFSFFEQKHGDKFQYEYIKGLGGWEKDELKELVERFGFETFLETIEADNKEILESWMVDKNVKDRKEMILGHNFNIHMM